MHLLILGGTGFVGPHLVEAAHTAGMTVTLFNRGKTNSEMKVDAEVLHGDRDPNRGDGLAALAGRTWDTVIDVCGYFPRVVGASAKLLAGHVGHYLFISTISVYADLSLDDVAEASPVGTLPDPSIEKVMGETYGPLKVLCEQAVANALPGRSTTLRPGLIVGPGDPTDRFTYWPVRGARGGDVLAPGDPAASVQFIDARDLAMFTIHCVKQKIMGTMNVVGPAQPFSMGNLLDACIQESGSNARLVWKSSEHLLAKGVQPWSDIPLWIPDTPDMRGFARINNQRALSAGLRSRPVRSTIRDTVDWFNSTRGGQSLRAGLKSDRERELLQ